MAKITIVGMGPGDPGYLTRQAERVLREAKQLVLRTGEHPVAVWLREQNIGFKTLDALYEDAEQFESLEEHAAGVLCGLAQNGNLVYAVPGHGLLGDGTVEALITMDRCALTFIPGLSDEHAALARAGGLAGDAACGRLASVPAALIGDTDLTPQGPLMVTQLDSALQAGLIKPVLSACWGDEAPAVLLMGKECKVIRLFEMDRQSPLDHTACLYLPPKKNEHARQDYRDLVHIMDRLRENCPWDGKQTHQSLKQYMLEEAHEAVDAIDSGDMDDLCSELGDVLLQVVFHARIASERGDFTERDVTQAICQKMISRHPHIFGDVQADTAEQVLTNWESIKKAERGQVKQSETMKDIPGSLPSLMRADKIQARAARVGFDWDRVDQVMDKLREEVEELQEEISAPVQKSDRLASEMGDILFAAVNVARWIKVEPELALRSACNKFITRFMYVEEQALQQGRMLTEMDLSEMDALWDKAKELGL